MEAIQAAVCESQVVLMRKVPSLKLSNAAMLLSSRIRIKPNKCGGVELLSLSEQSTGCYMEGGLADQERK